MTREDILRNPSYWISHIQTSLYNCAEEYMRRNNLNRTQLAEKLGVSKGYVSQLLNGDYDHKLSKLVELALAFGMIPEVEFKPIDDRLREDRFAYSKSKWRAVSYNTAMTTKTIQFESGDSYEMISPDSNPNPDAA